MSEKKCDLFLKNCILIPVNEQNTIITKGYLAIKEDKIIDYGSGENSWPAKKTIDLDGKIVMPGLINTHTHAAMTLFRGLADDLPLQEWLQDYIFPTEAKFVNEEMVRLGVKLACAEMIRSGTTTYCDMYYFEDSAAEEVINAGMRAVLGEALLDFPTPMVKNSEEGLAFNKKILEEFKDNEFIFPAIMPHSPYTCSPELLVKAKEQSDEYNAPYVIHLSETKSEVEESRQKHDLSPISLLNSLDVLDQKVMAAHCVHLSEKDIQILAEKKVKVAHCPESNMKLASGVAPIPKLMEAGVIVSLGTDGAASNNDLSLFQEMDTAAKLHKVIHNDPTVMEAELVVSMATINGARALGLDKLIGSIEIGKKADIIVVETNKPRLIPMYNPYSHLVYTVEGNDVWMTIIDGKIIYKDNQILTINEEEVIEKARLLSKKIKQ